MFNSNIKLLIVLLLAVVLICMINSKSEIPNQGEIETMDQTDADEPVTIDEIEDAVETEVEAVDNNITSELEETADVVEDDNKLIDSVLENDILPNDLSVGSNAKINEKETSVTAQNMQKLMEENEKNKLKFDAGDLLPREVNNQWFETDFSHAQVGVEDANLVTTDRYIIGVNTVGQSLKNPSYDLRSAPACPKFVVSPFLNSTIEPDFNIKSLE